MRQLPRWPVCKYWALFTTRKLPLTHDPPSAHHSASRRKRVRASAAALACALRLNSRACIRNSTGVARGGGWQGGGSRAYVRQLSFPHLPCVSPSARRPPLCLIPLSPSPPFSPLPAPFRSSALYPVPPCNPHPRPPALALTPLRCPPHLLELLICPRPRKVVHVAAAPPPPPTPCSSFTLPLTSLNCWYAPGPPKSCMKQRPLSSSRIRSQMFSMKYLGVSQKHDVTMYENGMKITIIHLLQAPATPI